MSGVLSRAGTGFIAAVISVLIFHQSAWTLFHVLNLPGLGMPPPFPTDPIPPLGIPRIVDLCFWGGLWGAAFGVVWRGRRATLWWAGLLLGIAAGITGLFIVPAIKGLPMGGLMLDNWIRSVAINGTWGLGVGLLLTVYATAAARRDDIANR